MIRSPGPTKGILPALLAYTIWGLLPLYWKLLRALPPDRIIAHRIAWSFVFVLLLLLLTRELPRLREALRKPRELLYLGLAAIFVSVNWFIYIYAVNSGQIVASSLGYYINPLVSIALGAIFYKEKFHAIQMVAIGLAVAGVAVIAIQVGRLPWISLVLAVSFGIYGLLKKKVTVSATVGLTIETAFLSPFALGYLLFAPAAGFFGGNAGAAAASPAAGSPLLLTLIPLAGIVTATPLLLFAIGAKHLDLSMVGFLQYLSPTLMLLIGVFVYGEAFTAAHAVCFGLIWTGLFLYTATKMNLWRALKKGAESRGNL